MCSGSRCPVPGAILVRRETIGNDPEESDVAMLLKDDFPLPEGCPPVVVVVNCSNAELVRNDALGIFLPATERVVLSAPHPTFMAKLERTKLTTVMNICHHADPPCLKR